jgi:hypothetical protein
MAHRTKAIPCSACQRRVRKNQKDIPRPDTSEQPSRAARVQSPQGPRQRQGAAAALDAGEHGGRLGCRTRSVISTSPDQAGFGFLRQHVLLLNSEFEICFVIECLSGHFTASHSLCSPYLRPCRGGHNRVLQELRCCGCALEGRDSQ